MATEEARRGEGIGATVIEAVIRHVGDHGGGLLWCSARTPAVAFYRRAGFESRGEPWDDPVLGPHIAMQRRVLPA
jgi:predicted GNAT family N-acyltransferase